MRIFAYAFLQFVTTSTRGSKRPIQSVITMNRSLSLIPVVATTVPARGIALPLGSPAVLTVLRARRLRNRVLRKCVLRQCVLREGTVGAGTWRRSSSCCCYSVNVTWCLIGQWGMRRYRGKMWRRRWCVERWRYWWRHCHGSWYHWWLITTRLGRMVRDRRTLGSERGKWFGGCCSGFPVHTPHWGGGPCGAMSARRRKVLAVTCVTWWGPRHIVLSATHAVLF